MIRQYALTFNSDLETWFKFTAHPVPKSTLYVIQKLVWARWSQWERIYSLNKDFHRTDILDLLTWNLIQGQCTSYTLSVYEKWTKYMYNERLKLMVKRILHNHRSEYMIITFELDVRQKMERRMDGQKDHYRAPTEQGPNQSKWNWYFRSTTTRWVYKRRRIKNIIFFFTLGFINKDHDKVIHNDHYKYVYAIYNKFFKVNIICIWS